MNQVQYSPEPGRSERPQDAGTRRKAPIRPDKMLAPRCHEIAYPRLNGRWQAVENGLAGLVDL
jgi:hypothetical protein